MADGSVRRMREIEAAGITAATVRRAVDQGLVTTISRGLYRRSGAEPVRGERLAQLVARVPNAVICLLSAAEFHGLGNLHSDEVWGAIPNGGRNPKPDWPPFRAVRWRAQEAREIGVETHDISGVQVRITNPARAVVDMLRMASTVGENRALDCLRDFATKTRDDSPPSDSNDAFAEVAAISEALGVARRLQVYLRIYGHALGDRQPGTR
jgi:predicted transcriptional regulator of viral defense system